MPEIGASLATAPAATGTLADDLEALWTHNEVARYARMSDSQLYAMNRRGDGPPSVRFGKLRRYQPRDVRRWVAARVEDAGSAA
jgi:predicted DNA-binding transcriptional regulator AlpA